MDKDNLGPKVPRTGRPTPNGKGNGQRGDLNEKQMLFFQIVNLVFRALTLFRWRGFR